MKSSWEKTKMINLVYRLNKIILSVIKVRLPPSKKIHVICFIESPLKMMKNVFYFILKAFLVLMTFKACVHYFHQVFISSPNDSPSKTTKNVFYFI